MPPGALDGLGVLDLTSQLSGPYCTMLLGDLGADVIKVERPDGGDELRTSGPHVDGESAPFMTVNRNKRSLSLDLKAPEGLAIARRPDGALGGPGRVRPHRSGDVGPHVHPRRGEGPAAAGAGPRRRHRDGDVRGPGRPGRPARPDPDRYGPADRHLAAGDADRLVGL